MPYDLTVGVGHIQYGAISNSALNPAYTLSL